MRTAPRFALLAALALAAAAVPALSKDAATEDVDVPTSRGAALKATLHRPSAADAVTGDVAVVLAPGQGYHRALPILARSAEALAAAGFTALRFDWAYFTAKGQPSEDLSAEVADVGDAVAFARRQPGVKRVIVAGKSLGSLVVERWATAHAGDVAGVALLTLPVNQPGKPDVPMDDENAVAKLPFEALIVCGDHDPLADRTALYRLAASLPRPPQVVVVPGDHSWAPASKDAAEQAENVDLAVRALVLWARRTAATAR